MAETYCSKTCAECAQKETLNCPGCKAGPGQQFGGDCDLAKCCRSKGHETCDTCGFKGNCGTLRSRDYMPDDRRRKLEMRRSEKAAIARRAPILGKWLWILFWLFIPAEIAGLMSSEPVTQAIPALAVPGLILGAAVNLAYCLILLKISYEEELYRKAGICGLVAYILGAAATLLSNGETLGWTLIFTIPGAIIGLVGDYQEFMAHSSVLYGIDRVLSDKWEKLWRWYIGCFAAMIGSVIVIFLIPVLGILVVAAAAIALLVIEILKLVHLYRTAKVFREFDSDGK